ncbi:MAG: beta-ketoacyl-[Bacteroidales bacterium]|nr:beta-ketoacyl-[acyl-carrier-protein] synthase family protein [Bacteroidales bacterium]
MTGRIVITGAGVVSAIGSDKDRTLESLIASRSGIGTLRHLKTSLSDFPSGEFALSDAELAAELGIGEKISRTSLLGIKAVREALAQAGIEDASGIPLIGGTTVGGMDLSERMFPEYSPKHDCGSSTDDIARYTGATGFRTTLSTACSSAANAIILGANLLRSGLCARVIAGGSECLTDYHMNGFNSLMILSRELCSPFDKDRTGLNLGEGAGFLVLETEESAIARKARPVAVLSGFGNACDAYHQTASSPEGEGAFLAMGKALTMAGLRPSDIGYINAHGTGTPNNDASESHAIRRVFGEDVPPVSSTKCFTGHTTSASGSIEAVFCVLALNHSFIPAQTGWKTQDPECITPYRGKGTVKLEHVMCNAFGFGGNDTSLIISNY